MKVLFAGPSIYGTEIDLGTIELRPPAEQGDLLQAALDGAAAIGLVDGAFEAAASVWHKAILYALGEGVSVVGGASMGALRAAECAAFGMEPVGVIAKRYLGGDSDDDALVAITHGPDELGSPPLVEALVDAEATIDALARAGLLTPAAAAAAKTVAGRIFYKERTVWRLAGAAFPGRAELMVAAYESHRVSIKTADAIAVVERLKEFPDQRVSRMPSWRMNAPPIWRETLQKAQSAR
jgi:hypothetical protein